MSRQTVPVKSLRQSVWSVYAAQGRSSCKDAFGENSRAPTTTAWAVISLWSVISERVAGTRALWYDQTSKQGWWWWWWWWWWTSAAAAAAASAAAAAAPDAAAGVPSAAVATVKLPPPGRSDLPAQTFPVVALDRPYRMEISAANALTLSPSMERLFGVYASYLHRN